ncbi:sugar transporter [Fragilaria crotonensis]|nr:sugar transporter [Fragilaria crotonensis]
MASDFSCTIDRGYAAVPGSTLLVDELLKGAESSSSATTLASTESTALLDEYIEICRRQETKEHVEGGRLLLIWYLLGFKSDPFLSKNDSSRSRNSAAADLRLAMLSNFSTAYNIVSISLALHLMNDIFPGRPEDKGMCSSALIAGMIIGQLFGGTLGDILGRHVAMTCVMCLQVFAAFFSALSADSSFYGCHVSIFSVLAGWRFVLGIGAGGVYPLAATITSESSQSLAERGKSVAMTFSMQGVGYLAVPLTTWLMVTVFRVPPPYAWRLLLGLGALPGIALTIARSRWLHKRTDWSSNQFEDDSESALVHVEDVETFRTAPVSVMDAILIEPRLFAKLVGTGGCWFLFDILFYGNTLFQPMVLSSVFGAGETVEKVALDSTIIACMALPGYIISIAATGRQSPRFIQLQGFLMMSLIYGVIGGCFHSLTAHRDLMLILYSLTFFWSNYGPNTTTFMLPSMTFSKPCRSTLNGISAACGKAGALLGTTIFVPLSTRFGDRWIMLACAFLSVVGFALTWFFVPTDIEPNLHNDEILGHMSLADRIKVEGRLNKVPMRVVYSKPSLFDFHDST